MKTVTTAKIVDIAAPAYTHRDDNRRMVEYVGFGKTQLPLEFRPIDPTNTDSMLVDLGTNVSYVLREYNSGTDDVVSVLILYFIGNGSAYEFTTSLCISIDKAAEFWSMHEWCC